MSKINIKCDLMADGWDYDSCWTCKRFRTNVRPRNWKCSLNDGNVAAKREFYLIWCNEYLRTHGYDLSEDEITIEYVGKRRRKNDKRS